MLHSFGGFTCSNMKAYWLAVWQFPFQPKELQTGFDFGIKLLLTCYGKNIPAFAIVVLPGRKDMSLAVANQIRPGLNQNN